MTIDHLIFLIHPCVYEGLDAETVRRDNLAGFVERERVVKQRWLDDVGGRDQRTLLLQLYGPPSLHEAFCASLGEANACFVKADFPGEGQMREYYRRLCGCIRDHMRLHDLTFDPETVTSELWGESFEGCAPGYGGAFAEYLELKRPPKMVYEMTVHDSRVLTGAEPQETVRIPGTDVEAWVFECRDSTCAAIFQARLSAQWLDRRPILLTLDPTRIQVCTKQGHTIWPPRPWAKGDPDDPVAFCLSTSDSYWVRSGRMAIDDFRQVISSARLIGDD